jgi:hypothetical protein
LSEAVAVRFPRIPLFERSADQLVSKMVERLKVLYCAEAVVQHQVEAANQQID